MATNAAEPDLFGGTGLLGLSQVPAVVDAAEEQALIAAIDAAGLAAFRFHGWFGKRLTVSYGWQYDFDAASLAPAAAIPDWLLPLRERVARRAGLPPAELAHALLIRYDPGAWIGWHRDRAVFEHVIGVSLGTAATMRFRHRRAGGFDRASVWLEPRSSYRLIGPARHEWEHSIVALSAARWSITFRSLARKGRRAGIARE